MNSCAVNGSVVIQYDVINPITTTMNTTMLADYPGFGCRRSLHRSVNRPHRAKADKVLTVFLWCPPA
jgi:hypothetical protein